MANRLGTNDPIYDASRLNTINLASNLGASPVDAITELTGDVTAIGPGSVPATLATVNANVGTFGSSSAVAQVTVNAKGLVTAAANVSIDPATFDPHNDGRYLKLDASNDPLTGDLDVQVDDANALRVLTEATPSWTFPSSAILDTFNRGDEGPPPSANWHTPDGFSGLEVISEVCSTEPGSIGIEIPETSSSFFTAMWLTPFSDDCEAYFTTVISGSEFADYYIFMRAQNVDAPWDNCYYLQAHLTPTPGESYIGIAINIDGWNTPVSPYYFDWLQGDQIGFLCEDDITGVVLTAYLNGDAVHVKTDSTGQGFSTGYIGVGVSGDDSDVDTYNAIDNFGGGAKVGSLTAQTVFNVDTLTKITTTERLESTVLSGLSPLIVASNTLVTNLNADLLDGQHASEFAPASHNVLSATHGDTLTASVVRGDVIVGNATPKWSRLALGGITGSVLTRTATDVGWSAGALSFGGAYTLTISGNSTINGSLAGGGTLATTSGQTYTFGTSGGTIPTSAGTLTVGTTNAISAAGVITHAITSSSNPGAAASILASNASGFLRLTGLGIGNTPDANKQFYSYLSTAATSGTYNAAQFELQISPGASASSVVGRGAFYYVALNGSDNLAAGQTAIFGQVQNFKTAGTAAAQTALSFAVSNNGAGTVTTAQGANVSITNASSGGIGTSNVFVAAVNNTGAGTTTTARLFYGAASSVSTGAITNLYGMYLDAVTAGSTLNYSIYGNAGLYRFGDQLSIVGGADRSQLIVAGYTTQTATVASIARADTAGTGVRPVLSLDFSGSGADNNGGSLPMLGRTTTTAASAIARLAWSLPTGTHASYKGRLSGYVSDAGGERQWLQVDTDGAQSLTKIGDGTTNYLQINGTGDLLLVGSAKYERHVQIDAKADGTVANQPNQVDFFTAGGLQYASVGSKYAFCQWEIPDDWDGTDVYFEIDWFPDSGAISGTDAVRWTVEYRAIAEGELINNGTSVTLDNGAGGDTADYSQYQTKHTRVTLAYNNANQPLTKQDHVYFKISRDTAVANDFAGSVTVTAYEIIYNSNGFPTSN